MVGSFSGTPRDSGNFRREAPENGVPEGGWPWGEGGGGGGGFPKAPQGNLENHPPLDLPLLGTP